MEAVFPLAAKYGAALVALTLDETGIPDTPEGRAAIAKRILKKAAGYGIDKKDIIFDALTLAVATDPDSPYKTLKTVEYISKEMKCRTILGVSNISFGLPDRDAINADFLRKALSCGLSGAIINPMSALVMNVMREYQGGETNALPQDFCLDYSAALKPASVFDAHLLTLDELIYRGLSQDAAKKAQELLASDAKSNLIDGYIIPALNKISGDYDNKTAFLPQLIACADAAKAVFSVIEKHLAANPAERTSKGTIVIATVEGDIHDIGKNIVSSILSNYGFNVIDLGRNVPASAVLDALEKSRARLVGLSALMTTTVKSMEKTISFVRSKIPDCRFMVGGAVLTPEYAKQIGADYYAEDATAAVTIASEFFKV